MAPTRADRIAEAAVELANRVPPGIRQLGVRGPGRHLAAAVIFKGMEAQFDAKRAQGLDCVVLWEIGELDGDRFDRWHLRISDGRCRARRGGVESPTATLRLTHPDLLDLATGKTQGPQLYLTGKIKITGETMLAQRLTTLFRVPGR